jgi:hypothetical protein
MNGATITDVIKGLGFRLMNGATITDGIESESSDEEGKEPFSKFGFGKIDHQGIAEELLGIGGK